MSFILKSSLALIGLLTLSTVVSAQTPADGEKVYAAQRCSICHSIAGKGNAKGALDHVASKLSAAEIRSWMTDAEGMTTKMKAARKPVMKSYPKMTRADLDALVVYLQSLK